MNSLIMDSTILYHQSLQIGKFVSSPIVNSFDGQQWVSSCTHNCHSLVFSHRQKRVALDLLYAEILRIEDITQKPSGKNSKLLFLEEGGTILIDLKICSLGVTAKLIFTKDGKQTKFSELFDSIGSLDRFVKATCALLV